MCFIVSILGCYCLLGSYSGESEGFLINSFHFCHCFACCRWLCSCCVPAVELVAMLWPLNCRNLRNFYNLIRCVSVCKRLYNIQTIDCFIRSKWPTPPLKFAGAGSVIPVKIFCWKFGLKVFNNQKNAKCWNFGK